MAKEPYVECVGCTDRTPDEAAGIRYWRDLADGGEAIVVTSTLTYAEVLEQQLSSEDRANFEAFMAGRVDVKDASLGVMRKAKELREQYQATRPEGELGLCTPDAIHLATALLFNCSQFHTFDRHNERGCLGLLRLGALPPGPTTKICKPAAPPPPPPPAQVDLLTTS